jgi:hypothetical protein
MFSQDKQQEELGKQKTAAGKSKQKRKRKGMTLDDRPLLEPNAAGIDIGAREIFVAVPADRDENPVRVFPTFTADLEEMARWLLSCRVTTVAMESIDHRYPADLYLSADKQGPMKCLGPSLLDSALRCAGAAQGHSLSGKRPEYEERARAEDGLA